MVAIRSEKYLPVIVAGIVGFFALFALWLRLLPMFSMGNVDILTMVASDDPLYNLRQVEQLLANNLQYAWFDPMTLYPVGTHVYWGPLFPLIIALCCMVTGASTRPEIISIALLVPPLLGMATVIVMYYVGKVCGDYKTGLFAAGFTAVVSGQFFYRSFYGYIDHHIGEVLFSLIFCLLYMYALLSEKSENIRLNDLTTYKKTLLLSCIAGIAYVLGLLVMPTMILFAMIVGIFTVLQFIIDVYRGRTSEYILIINVVVFLIAIIGLELFGIKNTGMNLSAYTTGHILAYSALIAGTGLLYGLQVYLKNRERYLYPLTLIGCGIIFSLVLFFTVPEIFNLLIYSLFSFFGQAPVTDTVQEARGWSMAMAWTTFNYGLLLMCGGILVMTYKNLRNEHPEQVFALVWSLIMLVSTIQHVRYEYYLAINIALLAAVTVDYVLTGAWPSIRNMSSAFRQEPSSGGENSPGLKEDGYGKTGKKGAKKKQVQHQLNYPVIIVAVLVAGTGFLFAFTSATYSYSNASTGAYQMNQDWKSSLEWMRQNTPETGVNYLTLYDDKSFRYPPQAYGVMSWWDYGHMITYIAQRIPNANPFQAGVAGPDGSAAYFMSENESSANTILDHVGTRYIVTDIEMDSGKFYAMATWYNATASISPYQLTLLVPRDETGSSMTPAQLNTQAYYLTMVSRLHNFDGSMTEPGKVYYIEYADPETARMSLPVMTNAIQMNRSAAAKAKADEFNQKSAGTGNLAAVLSPSITAPVDTIPALRHYRLVHESPTNVLDSGDNDVKYVKTFEYVRGAHIRGDGIIEVPVISNTGRNFIYRQQSVNGEFIVPYSTTGNPYEVKTTGKYRIAGTTQQFDVPESAVTSGLTIQ